MSGARVVDGPLPRGSVRFECTMCGACCREPLMIVVVTSEDIRRIAHGLGLSAPELLRALDFYVLPEGRGVPDGLRGIPRPATEEGLAIVALRKLEDGSCVFLHENACLIYDIRPSVCTAFPFVFRDEGDHFTWELHARHDICPGLGAGPVLDNDTLVQLTVPAVWEMELYQRDVEVWNLREDRPTALGFLEFILSRT